MTKCSPDDGHEATSQRSLRVRMAPELPAGLLAHIDRVVALTRELARRHGAEEARALLTAQGHDLLRALDRSELLARAKARGMEVIDVERAEPVLLHGPLGALELLERFDLDDERVLHAIRWHSSGHPRLRRRGVGLLRRGQGGAGEAARLAGAATAAGPGAVARGALTGAGRARLPRSEFPARGARRLDAASDGAAHARRVAGTGRRRFLTAAALLRPRLPLLQQPASPSRTRPRRMPCARVERRLTSR